ncbi:unnamed protein product [Rhizoctonia solani]|uniref:F-box domain-containing protein n=1 Tax=Rhizoctonia solani TaxID=456999 RepID=A0A8H3DKH7_9AGAM|nr:unnamed protein product [Rhizoctonia solani]
MRSTDDETKPEAQILPRKRARNIESTNQATSSSQAPARKKQVRGKQGRLAGLLNMPVDIFTEITLHLNPADIISLSRSNKFFRNMLMHRSSIHIWHGSMKNVAGLPPCPPDMSEPRYLALVFSKTCSKCGKSARSKPDGILRVRLCGPCRDEFLMPVDLVPPVIQDLVYLSWNTYPARKWRCDTPYMLSEDVPGLLTEYADKKRMNDESTLDVWTKTKIAQVNQRREESEALMQFLEGLDGNREKELDELKEARRSEIERRVKDLGWAAKDMPSDYASEHHRAWNALVNQPKPLTDRIWANLQPKLIPLLEARRVERLKAEHEERKSGRQRRLVELFDGIKQEVCSSLETLRGRESGIFPDSKRTYKTDYRYDVFPSLGHALAWPLVKDLHETDSTPEEMEARFEKRREEVETLVNEWRTSIPAHFLNQAKANGTVLRPVLTSYRGGSGPFINLSDDLKRLLRADSVFYTTSPLGNKKIPATYSSILDTEGLSALLCTPDNAPSPKPLSLEHMFWYPEAHEVAKTLLANLGKPDISYFEIWGFPVSKIYMCGRCHNTDRMTWAQVIQHYVEQKQKHSDVQKDLAGLADQEIMYNDVHHPTLSTAGGPPMIKYIWGSARIADGGGGTGEFQVCKLCEKIPSAGEVVASQSAIRRHLLDVHGITKPGIDKHYAPKRLPSPDLPPVVPSSP